MACVASLGLAMVSVDTMKCPHQCGMSPNKLGGASFLMQLFLRPLARPMPKKGVNPFFSHEKPGRRSSNSYGAASLGNSFPKSLPREPTPAPPH